MENTTLESSHKTSPSLTTIPSRIALSTYLKWHWSIIAVATVAGLLLGIVTAFLGVLTGPLVQVLSSDDRLQIFSIDKLFGEFYGKLIVSSFDGGQFSSGQISYGQIMATLPYLLIVIALARFLFQFLQWYLFELSGELVSRDLRAEIARFFIRQDLNQTLLDPKTQQYEQAVSSAITNDIKLVREYVARYYGGLPREVFQILFLTCSLIVLSPQLFAAFVLGLAPLFVLISRYGKKLKKRSSQVLQNYAVLSEWIQQRLLGIETIKHYHTENEEIGKLRLLNQTFLERQLAAIKVKSKISPLMEGTALVATAIVFYLALDLVFNDKLSGAIIINFFASLAFLSQSAGKLARYFNTSKEGEGALERLSEIRNYYSSKAVAKEAHLATHEANSDVLVQCHGLGYSYQKATPVLNNLTCSFKRGRFYAVYGATGAGKSTLFNLLLGVLKPQNGGITYHPLLAQASLPFCYIPQKINLSPGTLGDNISYPRTDYDSESVVNALHKVGLTSLLASLPKGLATPVGFGSKPLSGGQEQRIALARLFYWRLPLALIDEGTSAVDPENETAIFRHLIDYVRDLDATVIMIAHRPIAAEFADEIILLEQGTLVAAGAAADIRGRDEFRRLLAQS